MASSYNPFEKNEIKNKENWFLRTSAQIGALAITGMAIYKLGGKNGAVGKYFNQYQETLINRQIIKQMDRQEFELGAGAKINQDYYGGKIEENIQTSRIKEIEEIDRQFAKTLAAKAEKFERIIVSRGLSDIDKNNNKNFIKQNPNNMSMTFIGSKTLMDAAEQDKLFFKLRRDSLFEYMSRAIGLKPGDRANLESFKDEDKHARVIAAMHDYYINNSREYGELYNRNASRVYKIYRAEKAAFEAQPVNLKYDKADFKNRLYGNHYEHAQTYFDNSAAAASTELAMAKYVNKKDSINLFDALRQGTQYTSGSLNKTMKIGNDAKFAILSKFDYTPLLKQLAAKLEEINSFRSEKSMVASTRFEIIERGDFKKQQFFAKISFSHKTYAGKDYAVYVPLSQHGFLPGSTPGVSQKLDGLYLIEEAMTKWVSKRYGGTMNLKVNTDLENKTQQMLKRIIGRLDSNIMENEFSKDPSKAMRRLTNELNHMMEDAPAEEGNIRDAVKILGIRTPGTYSTKNSLRNLSTAMISMNNMKRMTDIKRAGQSSSIITLDLETISRDLPGPEWMAKDTHTEITKAGYSVSRYDGNKLSIVDVDDMTSDHGLKYMKEYGMTSDLIDWLRKDPRLSSPDLTNDEVWNLYSKYLKQEASDFKIRSGKSFINNSDFIKHVAVTLLDKVKKESNNGMREVFITTKNASFDLHLMQAHAPSEWNEIKRYVNFIDVQSVDRYVKSKFGGTESMALNKVIMRMIGGNNPYDYNIETPSNVDRAYKAILSKVPMTVDENVQKILRDRNLLSAAHISPVADIIFENAMLADQLFKIKNSNDAFNNLDEISKFYIGNKKIKDLDEYFLENQMMESAWSVEGMMASASALSHGNISKKITSLLNLNMLLPTPDNPLGKQWDQLFMGAMVRPKNVDDIKSRVNLADRRAKDRYWTPAFITKGEIDATNYMLNARSMENYYSHHVVTKAIALWNPWKGKEGYRAFSENAFKNHTFHFQKTIDLTDAVSSAQDVGLRAKDLEILRLIQTRVKKLAEVDGTSINTTHYEIATRQIMNEVPKGKQGIFLPKGTRTIMAKGDKSYEVIEEEFNGYITNFLVNTDAHNKVRIQAQVEYLVNGPELMKQSFNARSLVSKASVSHDYLLSKGLAYGGVDAIMNAEFLEKGYVGAQKQVLLERTIDKLIETRDNAKTVGEKERINHQIKRLCQRTNSEMAGPDAITMIHNNEKRPTFTNIAKDTPEYESAFKFLGNIDLSMKELGTFMADAGVIWNIDKARQLYKMAGGDDISKGKKNMEAWIYQAIKNSHKDIDDQVANTKSALHQLDKTQIQNLKNDSSYVLKTMFLPDLDRIAAGERIPMFFEPVRKTKDHSWEFGFKFNDRASIYNLMKGRNLKSKNLKFRWSLLDQIDTKYTHVSQHTIDHLKRNRRGFLEERFQDALKTKQLFQDALMSKGMTATDLTLQEITLLNDSIGTMKLEKLKRQNLDKDSTDKIKQHILGEFGENFKNAEDANRVADDIIAEIQSNKFAEGMKDSKKFISASAAEAIAQLGKKKGVFTYSAKKELGGAFTFNLRELLFNTGIPIEDLPTAQKDLLSMFKTMEKQQNSFVKVNEFGKDGPIVEMKKIIMHADARTENVANMLATLGNENSFGYLTKANEYRKRVTTGIAHLEKFTEQYNRGELSKETLQKSESFLKKSYLEYMWKGFTLDSTSIYARASELSPIGFRSTVLGANQVVDEAKHILKNLGSSEYSHLKQYRGTIESIANAANVGDIYMRSSLASKIDVEKGVSLDEHLAQVLGPNSVEYKNTMDGSQAIYAYTSRNPTIQAAGDAILEKRLRLVSPELADALGLGFNEAHVFSEHGKLYNMDFDGDQIEFVVKGLERIKGGWQSMKEYSDARSRDFELSISKALQSTTSKGVKLSKKLANQEFVGFEAGKMKVRFADDRGFIQETFLDASSQEANEIMSGGLFKQAIEGFKTSQLHGHGMVTNQIVKSSMDQLAFVGLSKNMIGLFTNLNMARTRQIMQVGRTGDDFVTKALIGNLNEGPAGLSQIFISLAKRSEDFERLSLASKAILNPLTNDKMAQGALKGIYQEMYSGLNTGNNKEGEIQGAKVVDEWRAAIEAHAIAAPRRSEIYQTFKAFENIDLMRDDANISHLITSMSGEEFIGNKYLEDMEPRSAAIELGDYLTKKFKLDTPSARAVFKGGGKVAAIGAAIYLAGNFFRPNQLSGSLNPLDAFTDLGSDIDGRTNAIASNMELDRSIPIDMVNASFSKKAFIRLNDHNKGGEEFSRSKVVNDLLNNAFNNANPLLTDWRTSPNLTYANYTRSIGQLGSNQLNKGY